MNGNLAKELILIEPNLYNYNIYPKNQSFELKKIVSI